MPGVDLLHSCTLESTEPIPGWLLQGTHSTTQPWDAEQLGDEQLGLLGALLSVCAPSLRAPLALPVPALRLRWDKHVIVCILPCSFS